MFKKRLCCALLCLALLTFFAACASEPQQPSEPGSSSETTTATSDTPADRAEVNIAVLAGPTGMGAAQLMERNEQNASSNRYHFTVATAPDQITASLINGELDIAAVPTNLASVLYNKTKGGVQVIACNTLGVLYMLENGDSVHAISDLRGKTVYATGQGSTPEYILNYLLEKNGLDPQTDLTIEYLAEHAELAAKMKAGDVVLGMLPEPQVSAAMAGNADLRVALNLTEEWNAVSGDSALIQGCLVVRTDFAQSNANVLKLFLSEYATSVEYVTGEPEAAAALMVKHGIVANEAIALRAIPQANICCMTGEEMKTKLSAFLTVLFEANPASVGGALPDDAFYRLG